MTPAPDYDPDDTRPPPEVAAAMAARLPIDLEAGWGYMERGVTKLKRLMENENEAQFAAEHYMNLYTTIYNMCTQKPPHDYSAELYTRYGDAFSRYTADRVLPSLRAAAASHAGDGLLRELWRRWGNHKLMIRWLSRFFNYLDRYYISRHSLHTLPDVGLMRFRDEVYLEVRAPARDAVLAAVAAERAGDPVDRPLLKNVLSISIEVGMGALDYYEADFEAPLLSATADHYSRVAAAWVEADSCPDYMAKAEACLTAEEERVDAYLHVTTRPKLLAAAEAELLTRHQAALLDKEGSGVASLLRDDRRPDLARMYRLFARVGPDGLRPVATAFQAHVEAEGQALVRRADEAAAARKEKGGVPGGTGGAPAGASAAPAFARPAPGAGPAAEQAFIRDVVALHDKYLGYVADCFAGASAFHKALKEAFEAFCNRAVGGAHVAELMANACDHLLRKGVAGAVEGGGLGGTGAGAGAASSTPATAAGGPADATAAVEGELDKVVKLLAYVSEKDMFSEYYRKRLARRLLAGAGGGGGAAGGAGGAGGGAGGAGGGGGGGINDDAERGVLARLKQQCGAQFTSKMEGMVTDLALAREKQAVFQAWRANKRGGDTPEAAALGGMDLSVTLLTTGYWPSYGVRVDALPGPMAAGVALFTRFYGESTSHRSLAWMHGLGSATVRGAFAPRPLELVVTTLQAAVLLLFNDAPGEALSFDEVKGRLGLPDEEAARTLHSFACGRHKVLAKAPDTKRVAAGDVFTVNGAFTDRMRRVKIPVPSVEDRRRVVAEVDKDRAHAVDAAVVRVMKARKALTHAQLTGEVVPQLARMFKPDVRLIKKRIESLIDREYLQRGEAPGTYNYLA